MDYRVMVRKTMLVALLVGAAACQKISTVRVDPKILRFQEANKTVQLTATELDSDTQPMKKPLPVAWTSDKPDVATVDPKGLVTTHKTGTAVVTASVEKLTDVTTVEVRIASKITGSDVILIGLGQSETFSPLVVDEAGKPMSTLTKDIELKVENPQIASVVTTPENPDKRIFTAGSVGETKVTATYKNITADFKVVVKLPEFSGLRVDTASFDLKVGGDAKIVATPVNGDKPVNGIPMSYTSSDPAIVTVDAMGAVKAVAVGKASIEVKAGDKTSSIPTVVKK